MKILPVERPDRDFGIPSRCPVCGARSGRLRGTDIHVCMGCGEPEDRCDCAARAKHL